MRIRFDTETKRYLADSNVTEEQFCEFINTHKGSQPHMVNVYVNENDMRVLQIFTNKKGLTIVSLSGMEWILVQDGDALSLLRIPGSFYEGYTLRQARSILDGDDNALADLRQLFV